MTKNCGIEFSKDLLHPRYWLGWLGLLIFAIVAQLPISFRHFIGRKVGQRIYKEKRQKRYKVVTANLAIAFPELANENNKEKNIKGISTAIDKMTLEHLECYGCAMVDYSFLIFGSKKRLYKRLEIQGREHLESAISENKNVMILLAHSVMLEFAPAALSMHYDCFGSYKKSKNKLVNWIVTKGRCRHVSFVVSREEGLRKLIKSLAPKKLLIFLPDEDLGTKNSIFVPFFTQQKSTLTTTARIAKMGKAVALPTFAYFNSSTQKYIVQILPALENYPTGDPETDAITMNQALENVIKEHPEQYMWMLKWYRTRPNNEASLY